MLEKILKLLDSFRENQISKVLHTNRERIVAMLKGPYFSDKIKPYFATMHAEGVPFTDFEDQPKQVTQIKEIINALYHAEQAFLDLETVNLRDGQNKGKDVKQLYFHTIRHGYQASYLLTHLDVELSELFANEVKVVLPLLTVFQNFVDTHAKEAAEFTAQLKQYPFSYKAGLISGITVDQMRPGSGQIDYSFLTQFSAVLPGYLQQFREYIQRYSPEQLANFEPTLNKTQLDDLQKEGFKLLNALENLQGESIFMSAKLFYYVDAIRRVINLSMSTLEQMGDLNESSQDVIRDNLTQLKYKCLVPLFALADRLEDEALLTPGTLSNPLMEQVKPLYDFLIEYTSKVVNFSSKGRELVTIEDDRFIHLRLAETEKRINEAKRNLVKIEQAQGDFVAFFRLLDGHQGTSSYLIGLPEETKKSLMTDYKLIEPYVKKIDQELNNNIIKALTLQNRWTYASLNPGNWIAYGHEKLEVKTLLALKDKIETALKRDRNTQNFHITLNEDLISSVHERAELSLFPFDRQTNVFDCNEASVLKVDPIAPNDFNFNIQGEDCYVTNADSLTTDQAFELYQFYTNKLAKLERAQTAYKQFMVIIRAQFPKLLNEIDDETKVRLRSLYCRFQPYMVDVIMPETDKVNYDELIVANLAMTSNSPSSEQPEPLSTRYFLIRGREQTFLSSLNTLTLNFQQRATFFRGQAGSKYQTEVRARELKHDDKSSYRANHLLKHTEYSKAIGEFKDTVIQLTTLFNTTTKEQLNPTQYYIRSGVPFPEVENGVARLKESKQVLGLKAIANSLYHIEQISKQLEALNNKSTETVYVYHLVQVYTHLDSIASAAKELYKDPYLALIASDISNRATAIYQMLLIQSEPYRTSPDTVGTPLPEVAATDEPSNTAEQTPPSTANEVQYGGIWYPLNAFMLVPAYIQKLTAEDNLTQEDQETIQEHTKQVVLKIEGVINSSSSYFKLFLKTPVMLNLFLELKEKLSEFTTLSHAAVLEHLKELNTEHFAQMLLEADEWEDRMGLQPGLLSGPMKLMLDEFYKGLVEPLGFVSQKHIELVTSLEPIEKRLIAVRERKEQATQEKAKYRDNHAALAKLLKLIATHDNFTTGPAPSPVAMYGLEQDLLQAYEQALPILKKHEDLFALLKNDDEIEKSPKLDKFIVQEFNAPSAKLRRPMKASRFVGDSAVHSPFSELLTEGLPFSLELEQMNPKQTKPKVELSDLIVVVAEEEQIVENPNVEVAPPLVLTQHIKTHCQVVFNYYQGQVSTHDTELKTAKEKERYLEDLHKKQKALNSKFVTDYTKKAIGVQIDAAINRYIGLLHVQNEYNIKLKEYLESKAGQIIEAAKRSDDIDTLVQEMIAQRVLRFDQKHYRNYAHLEAVMVALTQFKTYFTEVSTHLLNNNSYFETSKTLENKSRMVKRLETIAESDKDVKTRFAEMRAITEEFSFETTMLKHSKPNPFTLAWLTQLVTSFLTLLHIYKPAYIQRYDGLKEALTTPPSEQAINRYRLFEPPQATRRYALPPLALAVGQPNHAAEEQPVVQEGAVFGV
ncbi:hypothetical protein BN59_00139 [Legionella massiliensis]|uniref:SdhA, substrate of the Dot/Icm system n=1 Tax=Legionella massiliensis TaxID=1034943 RepID=A0A078KVU5_9GAMM|nr:hypothetical protein [Legionella massiliensis]CDZ75879.1 hypothetical protein BN59_00139 [Legionella massiliensis]CEE11617.1 hypothetical protein BN1094_00139 [Legionella massiliensis]